jgi:ribonuclease HII
VDAAILPSPRPNVHAPNVDAGQRDPILPSAARRENLSAMPNLALEEESGGVVCGIDEVGRGPLAGPVVAAAVVLDLDHMPRALRRGIDDSKALSIEERDEYCLAIRGCAVIGIGAASVREIDRINILRASLLAMQRAVRALGIVPDAALVDGNIAPPLPCPARPVIGGDGRSLSIAAASIVAKVTRDRQMLDLHGRDPRYGFDRHKGYATADHLDAVARYGYSDVHRRSFRAATLFDTITED